MSWKYLACFVEFCINTLNEKITTVCYAEM